MLEQLVAARQRLENRIINAVEDTFHFGHENTVGLFTLSRRSSGLSTSIDIRCTGKYSSGPAIQCSSKAKAIEFLLGHPVQVLNTQAAEKPSPQTVVEVVRDNCGDPRYLLYALADDLGIPPNVIGIAREDNPGQIVAAFTDVAAAADWLERNGGVRDEAVEADISIATNAEPIGEFDAEDPDYGGVFDLLDDVYDITDGGFEFVYQPLFISVLDADGEDLEARRVNLVAVLT